MGLLDKFRKKTDQDRLHAKSQLKADQKEATAKELTLAQLQEKKAQAAEDKGLEVKTVKVKKGETKRASQVLLKPLVTEKGAYLASVNKYIFEVYGSANKIEIKKAIQALYGVAPIKVNIVNTAGKNIRYGRTSGRTKDKKKAIITLKKGQSIQVYEGV
ncbi:MAG: 50S ribosomal protein L23 [Candidatus Komeilibacteria bacterium]|nr:50S ribosomal protein L23 [Candidatus Komeilibacteria bacterium]